jgi:uncharacterized membrane protein
MVRMDDGRGRWVLGFLYVDPDDPRLIVRKRYGFGWTLNFGRPAAWIVLALLLVLGPALALFGRYLR